MAKNYYISSEALCPFYRGEETEKVYCDGIGGGSTIRLDFPRNAMEYKSASCRRDWHRCPIARMLWMLDFEKAP